MPGLEAWATRLRPVSPRCTRIHQSRSTTTETPQPYRCAGAYADPIGLYKLGHRYYDPTLGRFTQPDPSATKPTPYLYADGDPVNNSDPTGLFSWPDVGSAIGGARGWPRCCNSCGRSLRRDGRNRRRGRRRGNGRPVGVAPVQGWEPWSREKTATLPRTLSLAASSADSSADRKSDQQGERLCLTRARRMRSLGSAACSSH
ncbi:RHS repeat-associated core domain-containing protein [Streptomyces salinarius]|uniref:RHS repeat-associated core domain-containing protein n=1 Tax=Streptomyces salinarius TaxID=2762598 RepID=UPI0016473CC9|nr:RHS repeat-associated core domain-containing protein [Streptomyces salinarius]